MVSRFLERLCFYPYIIDKSHMDTEQFKRRIGPGRRSKTRLNGDVQLLALEEFYDITKEALYAEINSPRRISFLHI